MGRDIKFSFDTRYKGAEAIVVSNADSLFQTAGAAMEKEREASEVEMNGWCRR